MEFFLRLFPRYRCLQEAAADRLLLQDRINTLQSQVSELQRQVTEAHEQERLAYQAMVNMEIQPRYGFVMFPRAPHMPEGSDRESIKPIAAPYAQGRDIAKRESAKTLSEWAKRQQPA